MTRSFSLLSLSLIPKCISESIKKIVKIKLGKIFHEKKKYWD